MTEEDTFNRLRRIPYKDMEIKVISYFSINLSVSNIRDYLFTSDPNIVYEREALLKRHGWTYNEFMSLCHIDSPHL